MEQYLAASRNLADIWVSVGLIGIVVYLQSRSKVLIRISNDLKAMRRRYPWPRTRALERFELADTPLEGRMFFFAVGIAFFHFEAVFEGFLDLPWISLALSVMGTLICILSLVWALRSIRLFKSPGA